MFTYKEETLDISGMHKPVFNESIINLKFSNNLE